MDADEYDHNKDFMVRQPGWDGSDERSARVWRALPGSAGEQQRSHLPPETARAEPRGERFSEALERFNEDKKRLAAERDEL